MFFELAYWDNYRYAALRAGQFLKIVEPNIEGLPRIVAACELAQEAYDGDKKIVRLVGSWARSPSHLGHDNGRSSRPSAGARDNYRSTPRTGKRRIGCSVSGWSGGQTRARGELPYGTSSNTMVILTRTGRMKLCVRTTMSGSLSNPVTGRCTSAGRGIGGIATGPTALSGGMRAASGGGGARTGERRD